MIAGCRHDNHTPPQGLIQCPFQVGLALRRWLPQGGAEIQNADARFQAVEDR